MLLPVWLAACGSSPPTHFYTLSVVAPQRSSASASDGTIIVGKVSVPASLDRSAIVTRNGANEVDVSDQARWAAPLDGMIRQTLAADLAARLGGTKVVSPGDPVPAGPTRAVMLNLRQFIGSSDGSVALDGDWSVQDGKQHVLLTDSVHLTRQVKAGDIAAMAAALSDMLGTLSDRIAAALATPGRA
jgi:uncharacterized lipoprotein YmbA